MIDILLAPLQGVTNAVFRKTFNNYFTPFDLVITPFIFASSSGKVGTTMKKRILAYTDEPSRVIPQILGKEKKYILNTIKRLTYFGYDEFNWNLGCPSLTVLSKQHGAGLLPFAEKIDEVLSFLYDNLKDLNLSIKMRLGNESSDEIYSLVDILNKYPLSFIVIHPRNAAQQYGGDVDYMIFKDVSLKLNHQIVYSGDVFSYKDYYEKREVIGDRVMVGRGLIGNPFLRDEIKDNKVCSNDRERIMKEFLLELIVNYQSGSISDKHLVDKMKEYIFYILLYFEESDKLISRFKKVHSVAELKQFIVKTFVENKHLPYMVGSL